MSTASKTPLWLATVIAALGLVVAGGALAWACTERANITLDPARGSPGAATNIDANGFVKGEVQIYWDSPAASNLIGTANANQANKDGVPGYGFTTSVEIPEDARQGDHTIVAQSSQDENANRHHAPASFEVMAASDGGDSGDGSQEASGDGSQATSGDSPQSTSGDSSQNSGEPSSDRNSEPAQDTQTSQSTSGPTSQEASGAGSRDERGETAGSSSMPGLGSGDDQARSEPTNEPTPDQSQEQAGAEDPAQNRQSVGEAPQPEPQPAPQNQPATDERDQVGGSTPDQSAPAAPAPEQSDEGQTAGAEANPAPAPTDQPATSESGEQVFEGSVGPSESTEDTGRAEDPLADGEAQQADPRAAESESEGEHPSAPSENTASGDLWSGLQADEAPSLTPTPGEAGETDPNGGMAGALAAGVALLGLGLTGLLTTVGVAAARRRRLATATTRARR